MQVKKLSKQAFNDLVNQLIKSTATYGIQAQRDGFDFAPLKSADDLRLDYDVAISTPKRFFQPIKETLLKFESEGKYEPQFDNEPFAVIGIHPYDMVAINQIDKLFSQDYCDEHYMSRRKNAVVIVSDVKTASENVFASSMGTATVKDGCDILVTDIGESYVVEAFTEKGQELLKKANGEDASEQDTEKREKVWENNQKNLNKHQLKCKPSDLPKLLEKAYDHPVWEEKAQTCFSCGSCNLVCPTCYCFDVKDLLEWDLKSGSRQRIQDGCLLDGFTKVAGDHEFRSQRPNRFRHRLYRKGKYVPSKIRGEIACVGCGRCISACLPDIANPVSIYNRLADDLGID